LTAIASSDPSRTEAVSDRASTPLAAEPVPSPLLLAGIASSLGNNSLDELEVRARSLTRDQLRAWLAGFEGTEEATLLTTCHRVELLLLVRSTAEVERWLEILPGPPDSWQVRSGGELVHHLFRVAAGRESLALGEVEVRQQVRTAQRSVQGRHPRPVLSALLSAAVEAAEQVAPSGSPTQSVASVAVAALLETIDRPNPRVLIVGAGAVGRQVAEGLATAAEVTVLFHHRAPPGEFLRATGAHPVPWERLAEELQVADAVVTAVKSGVACLDAAQLPRDRPLVLVDLGVPRNIDPDVRGLPNVRLIDLASLHARSHPSRSDVEQGARVETLARTFSDELDRDLQRSWVDAWLRSAEDVRQAELANARRYWGNLTLDQEQAIDRLTHRLVTRLLVPPARRIRSLPSGPDGDQERRLAFELLRPEPDDP
jgi:glutamyl-tRNA reductase